MKNKTTASNDVDRLFCCLEILLVFSVDFRKHVGYTMNTNVDDSKHKEMAMIPLHSVRDHDKVARLVEDIDKNGWDGAPLVVWDVYRQLLTGVHRYAAIKELGWDDSEVPTIDIYDVFEEAALDFDVVLEENGNPSIDDDGFTFVLNVLPVTIRNKYGIDMH